MQQTQSLTKLINQLDNLNVRLAANEKSQAQTARVLKDMTSPQAAAAAVSLAAHTVPLTPAASSVPSDLDLASLKATLDRLAPGSRYNRDGVVRDMDYSLPQQPAAADGGMRVRVEHQASTDADALAAMEARINAMVHGALQQVTAAQSHHGSPRSPVSGPVVSAPGMSRTPVRMGQPLSSTMATHAPQGYGNPSLVGDDDAGDRDTRRNRPNTAIWRLKYDGNKVDLVHYLAQLDAIAAGHGWNDNDKGLVLLANIEGNASRVMACLPKGCVSYTLIAEKLREMFAPEANAIAYRTQFQCKVRGANEAPHEFAMGLRELAGKAYPELGQGVETMLVEQYIRGQPQYLRFALAGSTHRTLQEAVAATVRLESLAGTRPNILPNERHAPRGRGSVKGTRGFRRPYETRATWPVPEWDQEEYCDYNMSEENSWYEYSQEYPEDYPDWSDPVEDSGECDEEYLGRGSAQPNGAPRPCYFCGKPGHFWLQCVSLLQKLRDGGFTGRYPTGAGPRPYGFPPQRGAYRPRGVYRGCMRAPFQQRNALSAPPRMPMLKDANTRSSQETQPSAHSKALVTYPELEN